MPQGSILGPLLFILFINDIVYGIDSNKRLFADDTSLFFIVDNAPYAAACLNFDLDKKKLDGLPRGLLLLTHLKQRHSYSKEN